MRQHLDELLNTLIERHYKRLVNVYHKRLESARDKEFAMTQFVKRMMAFSEFRIKLNDDYRSLMLSLEDDYRLGRSIVYSINKLRQNQKRREQSDDMYEAEIISTERNAPDTSLEAEMKAGRYSDISKFTDEELVRLYAEYQVYERFTLFLSEEAKPYLAQNDQTPDTDIVPEDFDAKNKEFTTGRHVLAMHYLFKYCHVKDADEIEKARFIHFLTGRNLNNIYKKVRNPLDGSDKHINEDLKYVRGYFEKLGMKEIVKMINNEIDAGII
ncbi:MAG TPA: hypothetical protein VIH57_09690 [Bacteroidales bacterium]